MTAVAAEAAPPQPARQVIYRHSLAVRLTHWINVLIISLLLMSGLNIFNAHPRLYWGQFGADFDHPWFELSDAGVGTANPRGVTRLAGQQLDTTGVLGLSKDAAGNWLPQGFPNWATLPAHRDLATARRWHFFLAWLFVINGAAYYLIGVLNGHLRRDIAPTGKDIRPRNIWRSIVDHIRLKHPVGEEAKRYNVLQKLTYLAVIVVLLPLMVVTGLTMSPGVDAAVPWLTSLFGGRQSARAIHFITANLIVLFVIVHIVEVFLAGVWNEIRSMITGRYVIRMEGH
ncbi:MAG TPA: cytochrome b/b6 domain-containing protein [Caulobacteraceae bacterium]|jgi:thiosulfate reductase cytochrome b subunit